MELRAKYSRTYRSQTHYNAFDKLEADPSVRQELDSPRSLFTHSKGKLYIVISFKTCCAHTLFKVTHTGGAHFHAKITVPLSAIITGFPLQIGDPSVGGSVGHSHSHVQQFTVYDEEVFAVEFKVVTQRNILGIYSANAETVIAHSPLTHDGRNAVYDGTKHDGDLEGIFDDDEDEEKEPQSEGDPNSSQE